MEDHEELNRKKELILASEKELAGKISAEVFEKPAISFWMVLVPLLFLYFAHRMQKYKNGRMKFNEDFMVTRLRTMDLALEAMRAGVEPQVEQVVRPASLPHEAEESYRLWVLALVDYYMELLGSTGDDFGSLARSAYAAKADYLLVLDRLGSTESKFYAAITPQLSAAEGASEIISTIERKSRQVRRELAESIFPSTLLPTA